MSSLPRMRVAHLSPGRLRLRTSDHASAEHDFFAVLGDRLSASQLVQEVRSSARTGSVLVLFSGEAEPVLAWVRSLGLVEVEQPGPQTPMLRLKRALEETETRLAKRTRGIITPGSLGFAVSAAAIVFQTQKGYLFPSALSLVEIALRALDHEAAREAARLDQSR